MKVGTLLCLVACCAVGCAGSDDGEEQADPIECDIRDRSGPYLLQYDERSGGTCGPINEAVVSLDDPTLGMMGTTDCVVASERLSKNECRVERTMECVIGGYLYVFTGFTDSNASGSRITGLITLTVEGVCASTYETTAVRQ